jgi:hypothetical protein
MGDPAVNPANLSTGIRGERARVRHVQVRCQAVSSTECIRSAAWLCRQCFVYGVNVLDSRPAALAWLRSSVAAKVTNPLFRMLHPKNA